MLKKKDDLVWEGVPYPAMTMGVRRGHPAMTLVAVAGVFKTLLLPKLTPIPLFLAGWWISHNKCIKSDALQLATKSVNGHILK